ncbi:hypothetical protein ACNKHR_15765 [Shigella flexneri]
MVNGRVVNIASYRLVRMTL